MREIAVPQPFRIDPDASAVDIVFDHVAADPSRPLVRRRVDGAWRSMTAGELGAVITAAAKGLVADGVKPGDRVALLASTRWEWVALDFAIWSAGAVTVPIFESSSADQIAWILEDSGAVAVIVEADKHRARLGAAAPETVYQIDVADPVVVGGALDVLAARGAEVPDAELAERRAGVHAADPATLIYTSGTTGRPKGCILTHSNLLSEAACVRSSSLRGLLVPGRRTLMFLPLAHVFARAITLLALQSQCELAFTADIKNVLDDFAEFQPDFILSVPRVFEKVYASARKKAHDGGKGKIFDLAAETAIAYSEAQQSGKASLGLRARHAVADKLVAAKLRAALGGRCQLAISGGAPLGARLGHFFAGIGVPVYEGYGLTESTAAIGVNLPGAVRIGTVGRPLPGNAYRIAADGEILARGPVIFDGYWQNPEATAEAKEPDGWFHTGDLGSIDADGFLSITGRKKELIVTAGGKNVAPAGLEYVLCQNPLVGHAVVIGDAKPFIAALVTIDSEAFADWKSTAGKPATATVADLVDDADLRAVVAEAVAAANRTVSAAEAIKAFRVLPTEFTEETGELTPKLSVKRKVVAEKFAADITAIYG